VNTSMLSTAVVYWNSFFLLTLKKFSIVGAEASDTHFSVCQSYLG
jgi:hypothetical protein